MRALLGGTLLVVLHLVLHVGLGFGAGAPDLLTLGLLIMARELGVGYAALLGLLLGLLEDALSVPTFGATALAMTVVAVAGARTRDLFVGDSGLFALAYLFVGKWVRDLLQWLLVGEEFRAPFVQAMLIDGALAALYVAVVGLAILALLGISWDSAETR